MFAILYIRGPLFLRNGTKHKQYESSLVDVYCTPKQRPNKNQEIII